MEALTEPGWSGCVSSWAMTQAGSIAIADAGVKLTQQIEAANLSERD